MAMFFNNRKQKKFLVFLLSLTMVASTVAGLAACSDGGNGSGNDTNTSTETDTARIKNGNFEFFDDGDGKNLIITSATNWTRTNNSASTTTTYSSKTASGIIDTATDAWNNLTVSNLTADETVSTEEEAAAKWSEMSAYDKLKFYQAWEDDDNEIEDLSFYDEDTDDFNITFDDLPTCENPLTHDYQTATASEETNVLMLHNYYTGNRGTAQKFTSSTSVTVAAGTSAKISLWVKTSDLVYADSYGNEQTVSGNRGAYIGITHTVGGETLDQMQVKNIDTQAINPKPDTGDWENNGWVQYTFYLQGCSYANSTFTMVLGLGQADGTKFEFVNGYAFFDDVECTLISNDDYQDGLTEDNVQTTVSIDNDADEKLLHADKTPTQTSVGVYDQRAFALDLYAGFSDYDFSTATVTSGLTEETQSGVTYVTADDGALTSTRIVYGPLENRFNISNDVHGLFSYSELQTESTNKPDSPLSGILTRDFEKHATLFGENAPILMLMSVDGATYTATLSDPSFVLDAGEKMAISFFLKTSDLEGFTGAGISLVNEGTETSLTSLDTSSTQPIDIDNAEDIYDGWQQCFFFVSNETEEDGLTFSLKFTFGYTTVVGTTKDNYHSGYAAFTGFETLPNMSKTQYKCISTGTYAASVSLKGTEDEETTNDAFDSAAYLPIDLIETDIATPTNYKGVSGGSGYTNNTSTDVSFNTNPYAGLINKRYIDNYLSEAVNDADYWTNKLGLTDKTSLENFFGNSTQPLLIYNDAEQAYGFIGSSQSVAASSYAVQSLRLKVSAGATAYVYLVDMDDYSHSTSLSIDRQVSYWYDDDGNVCVSDPSADDFNSRTDVAFKLQSNGLYLVNPRWAGATGIDANTYYANLANYETDEENNKLVADGGVSYDYNDNWKNDGNDGIAFYYANGNYYADSAKTILVKDFNTTSLVPRYTAADSRDLMFTVSGDTTEDWQTVTFFIKAGSQAKNYRLEIWSGSRDGEVKNGAGSYVLASSNTLSTPDEAGFNDRLDEYIENICDAEGYTSVDDFKANYANVLYNAYSFYDSNTFLRYDESLDKNGVGNSYDDYVSSTYSEGVSYLNTGNVIFANYSLNEQTPPVDDDTTNNDTTDDDTTEESSGADVWLLISSMAIAIALLIAIAALVIRKMTAKARKKKAQAATAQARTVSNRRYVTRKKDDK